MLTPRYITLARRRRRQRLSTLVISLCRGERRAAIYRLSIHVLFSFGWEHQRQLSLLIIPPAVLLHPPLIAWIYLYIHAVHGDSYRYVCASPLHQAHRVYSREIALFTLLPGGEVRKNSVHSSPRNSRVSRVVFSGSGNGLASAVIPGNV